MLVFDTPMAQGLAALDKEMIRTRRRSRKDVSSPTEGPFSIWSRLLRP